MKKIVKTKLLPYKEFTEQDTYGIVVKGTKKSLKITVSCSREGIISVSDGKNNWVKETALVETRYPDTNREETWMRIR